MGVFLFISLFSFPFMFFFIFLGARIQSIYIPFGVVCTAMERRNQENVRRRGINVTNYAGDPTTLVFLLLGKRSGENRSRPIIRANQLVWAFWASSKPINEPPSPRKKKRRKKISLMVHIKWMHASCPFEFSPPLSRRKKKKMQKAKDILSRDLSLCD